MNYLTRRCAWSITPTLLLSASLAGAQPLLGAGESSQGESSQGEVSESAGFEASARRLFAEGQSKYDTLDYEGAIEAWTGTYALFPDLPQYAAIRGTVLYAIAQARLDLYGAEKDVQHLRHAYRLLVAYRSGLSGDDGEAFATVQKWIRRIEAKIEGRRRVDAVGSALPPGSGSVSTDSPSAAAFRIAGPAGSAAYEGKTLAADVVARPGRSWVASGSVLLGLGAALAGVAGTLTSLRARERSAGVDAINAGEYPDAVSLADARTFEQQGRRAEQYQIISLAAGGVLAATGVTLLVVGVRKRPRNPDVGLYPVLTPARAGLSLRGSF
ncbi:MAG: hypothetical protein V3V08_07735 [Nannocystaceae bacterium]